MGCSAKSGRFFYYECNNHQQKGKEGCQARAIRKEKLENFVISRIKDRILTKENLIRLVSLINKELRTNGRLYEKQIVDLERQVGQVERKLDKLYSALEDGKIDVDDLAPRLKELRSQQKSLASKREEVGQTMSNESCQQLDVKAAQDYVLDLRNTLANSDLVAS